MERIILMVEQTYRCLTISDFNISNFNGYLVNDTQWPKVEPIEAPYGQVIQLLLETEQHGWEQQPDFVVVWTRPETVSSTFKSVLDGQAVLLESILAEVDHYASLVAGLRDRTQFVLVPSWVLVPPRRCFAPMAMQDRVGIDNILMRMNLRLTEQLANIPGLYVLNTQDWITAAGKTAFNPKLWYMGKIPFGNQVFKDAVAGVKAAVSGILGRSKKLVILDLDDTLWGGVVGDIGWENLQLGGHDPVGESFVDFQYALKSLTQRGVLLGLVSKNEESIALEAIRNHPEMVLGLDDFAGWRINWLDKARNVAELVAELNLGLDAVVYIDDNPFERARVGEALPQVLVPAWPEDKLHYTSALLNLSCFNAPVISEEDRVRTRMYVEDRQRTSAQVDFQSLDAWLKNLGTIVDCELLAPANLPRATQLLNKTNQMNLTTRRLSEQALLSWANEPQHRLWVFRAKDKFGDLGLIGVLSLAGDTTTAQIVDFVLSCRGMGRKVEETMLAVAVKTAQSWGMQDVAAHYIPTAKNKPCLEFWKRSTFQYCEENETFHWDTRHPYPVPDQIQLEERA
jgi:FkbH-like protein